MKATRAARMGRTQDPKQEDVRFDDADALTMAAMQGNESAVGVLIESGVSVNHKDSIGVTPLHWAAFCGHGGVTSRLVDAKADIHVRDREGRTPLHVAAYENHIECIRLLVLTGADLHSPDNVGWTPLHCAVSNGVDQACTFLTEAGVQPQLEPRVWCLSLILSYTYPS
jgi:ankyrin repeat protein